jgi:hypothetical protein
MPPPAHPHMLPTRPLAQQQQQQQQPPLPTGQSGPLCEGLSVLADHIKDQIYIDLSIQVRVLCSSHGGFEKLSR